jgi:hypothetical protein
VVKVEPRGPEPSVLAGLGRELLQHPELARSLGERHRLLSLQWIDPEPEVKTDRRLAASNRFAATFYSYTNNHTVQVEGLAGKLPEIRMAESGVQPLPSSEEFDEAVRILSEDRRIGPALRKRELQPYPPMPPLLSAELPNGRSERTLAVGLLPAKPDGGARHEIVGVNMIRREVVHFERGAPGNSSAGSGVCGLPYAGQPTASNVPGQVWVTVSQAGQVLWRFLAVRPAASSGTNGSGVELRFVDYKGKRVLYRAHVPILNVKYDGNACGPYRDWQNEEGMIHADGVDVAPGFRLCPTPATTILDTGSDVGNYLGVAIYVKGQEVVLVSEMQAGWYRYISEWRLGADGTIKPRFGFTAVTSSCVCNRHHHHAYWRLDFDLKTAGGNRVREFNDPPILGSSNWHTKSFEIKRFRDPAHKRKWRVENVASGEAYDIIPGPDDGVATASPDWPFPRGDFWVLRYRGSEIDDGVVATGPPYEAGLDTWVNGEAVDGADVVVWYGAHFTHDIGSEPPGHFGHIVGPTLKLVKW